MFQIVEIKRPTKQNVIAMKNIQQHSFLAFAAFFFVLFQFETKKPKYVLYFNIATLAMIIISQRIANMNTKSRKHTKEREKNKNKIQN